MRRTRDERSTEAKGAFKEKLKKQGEDWGGST